MKEKRFYWTRNTFFVLFPLLFIITYIFSGPIRPDHPHDNARHTNHSTITEVSPAPSMSR